MPDKHLSSQFDADLNSICGKLLEMGGLVESQVSIAMRAFAQLDPELADQVMAREREVNDFEISIDELDTAVDVAVRHGAIGARMTGGGFGGAAIALAPIDRVSEISLAVLAEFELLGYGKPNIFAVTADQGARRER